jgi:hypothetical protein
VHIAGRIVTPESTPGRSRKSSALVRQKSNEHPGEVLGARFARHANPALNDARQRQGMCGREEHATGEKPWLSGFFSFVALSSDKAGCAADDCSMALTVTRDRPGICSASASQQAPDGPAGLHGPLLHRCEGGHLRGRAGCRFGLGAGIAAAGASATDHAACDDGGRRAFATISRASSTTSRWPLADRSGHDVGVARIGVTER